MLADVGSSRRRGAERHSPARTRRHRRVVRHSSPNSPAPAEVEHGAAPCKERRAQMIFQEDARGEQMNKQQSSCRSTKIEKMFSEST